MPEVKHQTVGGRFLTPDDIKDSAIVKIAGAGEYKPSTFNPNRLELPIIPHMPSEWVTGGNDEKVWGMNPTSEATLCSGVEDGAAGYGATTEAWIGKLAKINRVKQMVGKDLKTVLYGEPIEGETPPQAVPKAKPTATPTVIEGETLAFTEAEIRYLQYNELLIETVLDPQDWQAIPKAVKAGLQAKGVLIDKDEYPYITKDARKALE